MFGPSEFRTMLLKISTLKKKERKEKKKLKIQSDNCFIEIWKFAKFIVFDQGFGEHFNNRKNSIALPVVVFSSASSYVY